MLLGKDSLPFGLVLLALVLSTCIRTVLGAGASSSQKTPKSDKGLSMEPGESSTSHEKTCQSLGFEISKYQVIMGTALDCQLLCMLEFYRYTLDLNNPRERDPCLRSGSKVCASLYLSVMESPNRRDVEREELRRINGKVPLKLEQDLPPHTNQGVLPALAEAFKGNVLNRLIEAATKGNLPKKTLLLTFTKAGLGACKAAVKSLKSPSTKNKDKSKDKVKDKEKDKGKQKEEEVVKDESMVCFCIGKIRYSLAYMDKHRGQLCDIESIRRRLDMREWNIVVRPQDVILMVPCTLSQKGIQCKCLSEEIVPLKLYPATTALWCQQWTVPLPGTIDRTRIIDAIQSDIPKLVRDEVFNEIASFNYFK